MFADLHIHSTYSDGTNTPEELVDLAVKNGVSVLALSDHDTLDGIERMAKAAAIAGIENIPAVEISTSVDGLRIHVLGYFIDTTNKNLRGYLSEMAQTRTNRTKLNIEKLSKLGILDYSWEDVLRHNEGASWITGVQVFNSMIKDKKYSSWDEWKAFYKIYVGSIGSEGRDIPGFTAESAVEIILEAGGVPVLAHPKLIYDDSQIQKLVKHGLMGIEAYYPAHNEEELNKYIRIAKENNLLLTGGTDWHGAVTEWDVIVGSCGIDHDKIEKLKRAKI